MSNMQEKQKNKKELSDFKWFIQVFIMTFIFLHISQWSISFKFIICGVNFNISDSNWYIFRYHRSSSDSCG